MKQIISISSDHAGIDLKEKIKNYLSSQKIEVVDHGPELGFSGSVDYPEAARKVAEDIQQKRAQKGILICGSGIGMSIAANKFKGIRSAVVWDELSAKLCKEHNNVNILCLGARMLNHLRCLDLVHIWLTTEFEGGRHQSRLDIISRSEN